MTRTKRMMRMTTSSKMTTTRTLSLRACLHLVPPLTVDEESLTCVIGFISCQIPEMSTIVKSRPCLTLKNVSIYSIQLRGQPATLPSAKPS